MSSSCCANSRADAWHRTGPEPPRFIKDEFDAFLECGILAHGFPRLRCGDCGYEPAFHPLLKAQLIAERFKAWYRGAIAGEVIRHEPSIRLPGTSRDRVSCRRREQRTRRRNRMADDSKQADPTERLKVFVYGTLKEGFPNFDVNTGRRIPGEYRTCLAWPLFVVDLPGEPSAPWLVDAPGQGLPVLGQLFQVDEPTLAAMDRLEEVDLPEGYVRRRISIERVDAPGEAVDAFAYLKRAEHLVSLPGRIGPLGCYDERLAARYRLEARLSCR